MINNLSNVTTPAESIAHARKANFDLARHGIAGVNLDYWNLRMEALYEEAIFRREGALAGFGPFVVNTGKHTARSANDKFIVREAASEADVWWGQYNHPMDAARFDALHARMLEYMRDRDIFVQDVYAGADDEYRLPVRVLSELAWHNMFVRNMFIKPQTPAEYRDFVPEFTLICLPSFQADPAVDGTNSETFICISFEKKLVLIGNTAYAGETKKAVFTVLNYLLPLRGVLSMHCSANVGPTDSDDVALFFGLSGTGKTTLSADPTRRLIGDDEHGWSDRGVFNFEGGCYAKVIGLSATAEPDIYATTRMFSTILENVPYDLVTRHFDLDDDSLTENTRASYPLSFIRNAVPEKKAGHPRHVVLLTCDASGVMPPLARLTPNQALYQFVSGYTSKIAGTEVGVGKEPQTTFSACFGAPFMVHHPYKYAELLKRKIEQHHAACWLLNTGWIGGPYGVGKRIGIKETRALLGAALAGELAGVKYYQDPIFGFEVPETCPGVADSVLQPWSSWPSKDEYMQKYSALAARFRENFKKFESGTPREVVEAGPRPG